MKKLDITHLKWIKVLGFQKKGVEGERTCYCHFFKIDHQSWSQSSQTVFWMISDVRENK